tara:strand:+ start:332 stop:673 length:342 start_codon:yes stop_codon:yes gene_type:complete
VALVILVDQAHEEVMEVIQFLMISHLLVAVLVDHMTQAYNLELMVDQAVAVVKLTLALIQTKQQVILPQLVLLKEILVVMVQNQMIKEQAAEVVLRQQELQLYQLRPIQRLQE